LGNRKMPEKKCSISRTGLTTHTPSSKERKSLQWKKGGDRKPGHQARRKKKKKGEQTLREKKQEGARNHAIEKEKHKKRKNGEDEEKGEKNECFSSRPKAKGHTRGVKKGGRPRQEKKRKEFEIQKENHVIRDEKEVFWGEQHQKGTTGFPGEEELQAVKNPRSERGEDGGKKDTPGKPKKWVSLH